MEQLILRFSHVTEQIFQQLENKDLAKCREVKKLWQKFIDEQKTIPLRKLQAWNQLQSFVKFAKCFEKIRNFSFPIGR